MSDRDIVERLNEKAQEPTETVMRQWDEIRRLVEVLPGASLPRDLFEGIVSWLVEDCDEAAAEILRLRAQVAALMKVREAAAEWKERAYKTPHDPVFEAMALSDLDNALAAYNKEFPDANPR